jgi:hypothetical protein
MIRLRRLCYRCARIHRRRLCIYPGHSRLSVRHYRARSSLERWTGVQPRHWYINAAAVHHHHPRLMRRVSINVCCTHAIQVMGWDTFCVFMRAPTASLTCRGLLMLLCKQVVCDGVGSSSSDSTSQLPAKTPHHQIPFTHQRFYVSLHNLTFTPPAPQGCSLP